MMRLVIISDNHGDIRALSRILKREKAEHVIHCGDFCSRAEVLPMREQMTIVRGNCDFAEAPAEAVRVRGGYRFLVTHGHRYQVKSSLLKLSYRAEEVAADIVCFGHSHVPYCTKHEGRLYVNPGSIVQPRGYTVPTYAVLQTGDNNTVKITFYDTEGVAVPDLGGTYALERSESA